MLVGWFRLKCKAQAFAQPWGEPPRIITTQWMASSQEPGKEAKSRQVHHEMLLTSSRENAAPACSYITPFPGGTHSHLASPSLRPQSLNLAPWKTPFQFMNLSGGAHLHTTLPPHKTPPAEPIGESGSSPAGRASNFGAKPSTEGATAARGTDSHCGNVGVFLSVVSPMPNSESLGSRVRGEDNATQENSTYRPVLADTQVHAGTGGPLELARPKAHPSVFTTTFPKLMGVSTLCPHNLPENSL